MPGIELRSYHTDSRFIMFLATDETYRHMGFCMRIALAAQQYDEYHRGRSSWLEYYDDNMERVC